MLNLTENFKWCKCKHGKPCLDSIIDLEKLITDQKSSLLKEVSEEVDKLSIKKPGDDEKGVQFNAGYLESLDDVLELLKNMEEETD